LSRVTITGFACGKHAIKASSPLADFLRLALHASHALAEYFSSE
jgi:hypothetical protein